MQATFVQGQQQTIEYTRPESDVDRGSVQVVGQIAGVDVCGGPADDVGALCVSGIFDVVKTDAATFAVGAEVYWDATGDPFGGDAESGAATDSAESVLLGYAVLAAGAEEETVRVKLWQDAVPSS